MINRIKNNIEGIKRILKGSIIEQDDHQLILDRLGFISNAIDSEKSSVISPVIERSGGYDTAAKRIVKVISDLNIKPLKNKLTENQKLEAQIEWQDYLKETIQTSI